MRIQNQQSTSPLANSSVARPADVVAMDASPEPAESFEKSRATTDYVTVNGHRFAVSGQQLADAQFRYIDGRVVNLPDSNAVAEQLARTPDGSLDSVRFSGHGRDDQYGSSMGFDVDNEGAPGLTTSKVGGRPALMLDVVEGNRTKQVNLGKLMENKWAPGGQRLVELNACDTGNANGLASQASKVLPGIRFQGVSGTLLENRVTGSETPAAGPDAVRQFVVPRGQAGRPGSYNAFPVR